MWRGWCDEEWDERQRDAARRAQSQRAAAALRTLVGLDASMIPQRQFPLCRWYYANPLWYYHAPATEHRLHNDPHLCDLLDPALREVCRMMLTAGLFTTPSCQGHFYPRERFERVWGELRAEAEAIREGGLVVRDSESGETYMFSDRKYVMPWADFETFYREADVRQTHGYLGVAVPPDRHEVAARLNENLLRSKGARVEPNFQLSRVLKQSVFDVSVETDSPSARDRAWAAVTEYFRGVLA